MSIICSATDYVSSSNWFTEFNVLAPSPTHWCSSYRKGSLRVTLDYGRQLYLLTFGWGYSNIVLHAGKQGVRSVEVGALAPECEKSETETKQKIIMTTSNRTPKLHVYNVNLPLMEDVIQGQFLSRGKMV